MVAELCRLNVSLIESFVFGTAEFGSNQSPDYYSGIHDCRKIEKKEDKFELKVQIWYRCKVK